MTRALRFPEKMATGVVRNAASALSRLIGKETVGPSQIQIHAGQSAETIDLFFPQASILPSMIYPGARVDDRYWIEDEIGVGGLCFVHRVRDEQTGQAHALKTLQPSFSAMPFYFELMQREAEIQTTLQHPNILSVDRLISPGDGRHALLLPYLAGGTLSQRIRRDGPLSPADCETLLSKLLDVLACLRRSGITHLDIAPDNIMFAGDDMESVRLIDFGLSRQLGDQPQTCPAFDNDLFLGKTSWASPEMLFGGEVTPDSDLFSLGLVTLFAATGIPPSSGDDIRLVGFHRDNIASPYKELLTPALSVLLDLSPLQRGRIFEDDHARHLSGVA